MDKDHSVTKRPSGQTLFRECKGALCAKVIEDEASERELACTSVYASKVVVTLCHTGHPETLYTGVPLVVPILLSLRGIGSDGKVS